MDYTINTQQMIKVLFVCMGNICRSPAAEIIFRSMLKQASLNTSITADSAGTIGYHEGAPPDKRMLASLAKRGYQDDTVRARRIKPADLDQFDFILTMDQDNLHEVKTMDKGGKFRNKIMPMCQFVKRFRDTEVPDPYYGGQAGFDHVIDLLEDGCANLIAHLKRMRHT